MSGSATGLTRLNYFNGMRLEAPDLRVEQHYHIDVRRRLTRALFSSGIAEGLEVVPSTSDPHHVIVRAGLALDHEGKVMVVDEDREVLVQGIPSSEPGWVFGNYLTISYREHKEAETVDGCKMESGCCDRAWGGPTRIVADPLLAFQDAWPDPQSGAIVLAQVELDDSCAVKAILKGVRKYATPVTAAARSFALEGEREIDELNSKKIFFHLRGPTRAVVLYLRALPFSTLFYRELGAHTHGVNIESKNDSGHVHDLGLGTLQSSAPTPHSHVVYAKVNDTEDTSFDLDTGGTISELNTQLTLSVSEEAEHTHTFDVGTVTTEPGPHKHDVVGDTGSTGQSISARSGSPRTYVEELEVWVDGANITPQVLNHVGWNELGDGTSGHDLVTTGTAMGIPLDQLGLDPTDGEHVIELVVKSGGGCIQYNLYVE